MSATVLYMSVSLDGFIAGPNAGPGNGLGDGGERLHEWLQLKRAGQGCAAAAPGSVPPATAWPRAIAALPMPRCSSVA